MTNNMSILNGLDTIFDQWLAVPPKGKPPYYSHLSADLALSGRPRTTHDPLTLVAESLRVIERNWTAGQVTYGKSASPKNWRFQQRLDKNPANLTSEVPLERALVDALGDDGFRLQCVSIRDHVQ
jgi:hypothetical protein